MNTIQELAAKYNELDITKGRELGFPVAVEIHRLNYQWLKEFSHNNPILLNHLDLLEKHTALPPNGELLTRYIDDSRYNISKGKAINIVIKKLSETEREQCMRDHRRAILSLYIEVFNSDELSIPNKIILGNFVKNAFQTCLDLNDDLDEGLSEIVKIISRRVNELESPDYSSALYYWPDTAPSFDDTIQILHDKRFVKDISFARDTFKRFEPEPLEKIRWLPRNRRLFIYFLLVLYGRNGHNGESITEIAYKLFHFDREDSNRKNFNSEVGAVTKLINEEYQFSPKYTSLKLILNKDKTRP